MESLCVQLNKYGIHANRLEYPTYQFDSPQGDRLPWVCQIYKFFDRIPKIRVLSRKIFRKYIILFYSNIIKEYDILELQSSFKKDFAEIAMNVHNSGVKIKTTLWGSDLYWETEEQRPWKDKIYKYSDIIPYGGEKDKNFFSHAYPQYAHKRLLGPPMGREQFDILEKMFDDSLLIDDSFLSEEVNGKLMVTCGYNGREMQQHILILDAINQLPQELKQRVFLFLPMTYLLTEDYFIQVHDKLEKMGIPYQIQKERLSLEQNLTMRMKTDIVVNIQKTDGLAASLQEHLYCGNVLIAGDWLPYDIFTEHGIYYCKTLIILSTNRNV